MSGEREGSAWRLMRLALPMAGAGLLAAAVGPSCTSSHPPELTGAGAYAPDAEVQYQDALARWTQEARAYDGFETKLILRGTLRTPAFQEAYGWEQARMRLLPPPERDALIDGALRAVSDRVQILFGASSPKHTNMGLTKPGGLWEMRLYDDAGSWANPIQVKAFHKESRMVPSLMFPYITRWDDAYVADFPLAPNGSPRPFLGAGNSAVIFQLAGEPGAAELRWEVGAQAVDTARPMPTPTPLPAPEAGEGEAVDGAAPPLGGAPGGEVLGGGGL